jgi:hypothetical protein
MKRLSQLTVVTCALLVAMTAVAQVPRLTVTEMGSATW